MKIFCIKDGRVEVALPGTKSHLEWFRQMGWVTQANQERFLRDTICGFFLPGENSFFAYKGECFFFDEYVVGEVKKHLAELKQRLNLQDDTEVFFGPRELTVRGVHHPRRYEGVVKVILNLWQPSETKGDKQ